VLSPNGHGENDIFIARGTAVRNFKMVVYDRWGNKVFESEDISKGWDGTYRGMAMNSAVFVYYILSGDEVLSKGNVTLLR
jgi:gliding motility-associated-like protein